MPFRCYLGYDSHEDITFEVSAADLSPHTCDLRGQEPGGRGFSFSLSPLFSKSRSSSSCQDEFFVARTHSCGGEDCIIMRR
jgi:hypothetical protein